MVNTFWLSLAQMYTCPEAAADNMSKALKQEQICTGCMHRYTDLIVVP